ncbi:MAG: hypothetical protein ACFE95_07675 [Candidatus Hodarchaeota archaeon]
MNDQQQIPRCVVYRDEAYPSSWIEFDNPKKISDYLTNKNRNKPFVELNAAKLKDWMEQLIRNKDARNHVLVFSQDVIPMVIYHDKSDNLVREYLYYGGRIVWIGDIPFFSLGLGAKIDSIKVKEKGNIVEKKLEEPTKSAFRPNDVYAIFGGSPSFAFSDSKIKITSSGEDYSIRNKWYSMRPMCPKFIIPFWHFLRRRKQILAKSILSPALREEETNPQKFRGEGSDSFSTIKGVADFLGNLINIAIALFAISAVTGSIAWSLDILTLDQILAIGFPASLTILILFSVFKRYRRKRYASAWIKLFENDGEFIRIWDFRPKEIPDEMIDDLYRVAIKNLED